MYKRQDLYTGAASDAPTKFKSYIYTNPFTLVETVVYMRGVWEAAPYTSIIYKYSNILIKALSFVHRPECAGGQIILVKADLFNSLIGVSDSGSHGGNGFCSEPLHVFEPRIFGESRTFNNAVFSGSHNIYSLG